MNWSEKDHHVMLQAIAEAERSVPEDDRPHPKVGAILMTRNRQIVLRAHRGEGSRRGDHAERNILRKAELARLDLKDLILVVTLEPCAYRSPGKIPCAIRVRGSGISEVWVGALDPDPRMRGRGEEILRYAGIRVERFPDYLVRLIRRQSAAFIRQFEDEYCGVLAS